MFWAVVLFCFVCLFVCLLVWEFAFGGGVEVEGDSDEQESTSATYKLVYGREI